MFHATLITSDKRLDFNHSTKMLLGFQDSFLALRSAQYVHLALPQFDGLTALTKVLIVGVFIAVVAASLAHIYGVLK